MTEHEGLRDELVRILEVKQTITDEARAVEVAKHHARGRWTVREVLKELVDDGSFVEYGGLAMPANPAMSGSADGLVMGTAQINGTATDIVMYDYTVYAGTQGAVNHQKISRMFQHAHKLRVPVVCWLDGGGARPHDMLKMAERGSATTFVDFARLSGWVPTVGIVTHRAFAGQANLAGMCDLLIAVKDSAIGMAGPPLVQAALGVRLTPQEVGGAQMHTVSGVVDVLVDDEAGAIRATQQYLSYFEPSAASPGVAPDPLPLRDIVPQNPRRAYDVRRVIKHIADVDSVMELKAGYGKALVTSLVKIDGKTVGVLANQPMHLGGAMDSPACIKGARFIQLCDAFDIPLLVLCDTPGLMVGPDAEKTGLVRNSARFLVAIANATVPVMTVVLRKAYGLGRYVMGSRPLDPVVLLAWPTTEYGGMGMEGAVNIIYEKELAAIESDEERDALRTKLADELREENTALKSARRFNYDDIIDPAQTRHYLVQTMKTFPPVDRSVRKHIVEPF